MTVTIFLWHSKHSDVFDHFAAAWTLTTMSYVGKITRMM